MLYTRPPRVDVLRGDYLDGDHDAIIVPVRSREGEPLLEGAAGRVNRVLGGILSVGAKGKFKGSPGETLKAYYKGKIVVFIGLGGEPGLDDVRLAYAKGVREVADSSRSVAVLVGGLDDDVLVREAVIASLLAAYKLTRFKTSQDATKRIELMLFDTSPEILNEALAVAEGVYLARDVANAPPNDLAPPALAEKVANLFKELGTVNVEVLKYEELVRRGFGGIVAVGKGSAHKPVLIILKYSGGQGKPIAIIGKTIVFDTGGINLKPSQALFEMRADKAGGAAVLGAVWAAARLGLKVNLVALIPAAINAPSGEAYLPSDVIKMWDGTTVEVTNTDAEGRLTLADAIAYAAKELDAAEIVDLATLTGAAAIALGPLIAALFTRDERLYSEIVEASRRSGEKVWRMPMEDAYRKAMERRAPLADIANAAMRFGGAIYAALFLEKFSAGKPFAHIDIAGPGIGLGGEAIEPPPHWPKGLAPGWGARLLIEYLAGKTGERQSAR